MKHWALILLLFPYAIFGQDRCATDNSSINVDRIESSEDFNTWLNKRMVQREMSRALRASQVNASITLPIVFHIIHNGEALGVKTNLAEERIIEQMVTLNEDFRRTNPDAINTPAQYLNIAADTEINFVLAKQDPNGLPTNGITRTFTSKTLYQDTDLRLLTSTIQWPPEDYINVYVCNFQSLGYAVFPFSDLPGSKSESQNLREIDGMIVKYSYIGNNSQASEVVFPSKGRTLTHELGHYLGVFHNWHGGCGTNGDYCADTPPQSRGANGSCDQDVSKVQCEEEERPMIENFMDYTNDECMNLFTICQKNRMQTVLQYSPRRASLKYSHALQPLTPVANDLGIFEIRSPLKVDCTTDFFPSVEVMNFGNNSITQFKISLLIDGILKETIETTAILEQYQTIVVSFSLVNLATTQFSTVGFQVTQVNSTDDANSKNDYKEVYISPTESNIAPYTLDFADGEPYGSRTETDSLSRWKVVNAPNDNPQNVAAMLPFFGTKENFGVKDLLLTNILDLSALTSARLNFKYAYAGSFTGEYQDRLIVAISKDCGATFSSSDYIFDSKGNALVTTENTSNSYIPSGASDWMEIDINITPWISDNVQIAFIGVNGGGNNLYIDNIFVTSTDLPAFDIGIRRINNMPITTCRNELYPSLNIRNFGYEMVDQISVEVMMDDTSYVQVFENLNIASGQYKDLPFKFEGISEGPHTFSFDIQILNDTVIDSQLDNNYVYNQMRVDSSEDEIPVKETFNSEDLSWSIISPTAESFLELQKKSRFDNILVAKMYNRPTVGAQTYFVSPKLETAKYSTGAIRFKLSYARRANFNDNLKILLSNDCGATYDIEVYNRNSADLADRFSEEEWNPTNTEDWSLEYVDISDHLGWTGLRVALVFTSGQGNNIYIDDLEIITYNDPLQFIPEANVTVYPNPAKDKFDIVFNLPKKQTVTLKMVDISGRVVIDKKIPNALNQKIPVLVHTQKGIYFVTVLGPDVNTVKRMIIE